MSAAETLSKNEYLAKNQSFKEKFENLKTISQPGTLSADIPASYKGFYSSYNPPINFRIAYWERVLLTFLYFPEQHLRLAFLCHYKTSSVFFFKGTWKLQHNVSWKIFSIVHLNFCSREKVKMQIKKVKKVYPDGAGSIVYGRETSRLINTWMWAWKILILWPFLLLVSTRSEYLPNYLIDQFSTSFIF